MGQAAHNVTATGDTVTAQAGVVWDQLVAHTVAQGWSGLAAMSGIPGLSGATPVQNVGAYGSEVADYITAVSVLDRDTRQVENGRAAAPGASPRTTPASTFPVAPSTIAEYCAFASAAVTAIVTSRAADRGPSELIWKGSTWSPAF